MIKKIYNTCYPLENRALLIGLTFLILLVSFLPTLLGIYRQTNNRVYLYTTPINQYDRSVYYSYIQQYLDGAFLLENLYTTEPQMPRLFLLPWFLAAIPGRIFSLSPPTLFHLARAIGIVVFIPLLAWIIRCFFKEKTERRIALLVTLFGAGLGMWQRALFPPTGKAIAPFDVWVPESQTLMALETSPHFILSLSLLMLTVVAYYFAFEKRRSIIALASGAAASILLSFHPFLIITVCGIPFVYSGIRVAQKKITIRSAIHLLVFFVLPILPIVVYYLTQILHNPILAEQAATVAPVPALPALLTSYGLLWPLAIVGFFLKKPRRGRAILFTWLVVTMVAIYLPIPHQRRLIEGAQIPISLFATGGIVAISRVFSKKFAGWTKAALVGTFGFLLVFFLPNSPLFHVLGDVQTIRSSNLHYISRAEDDALRWLRGNTDNTAGILSPAPLANYIPGRTGRRVYIGHAIETPNSQEKNFLTRQFYTGELADPTAFLRDNNITHIIFPVTDTTLINKKNAAGLQRVYENNEMEIYQVP